MKKQYPNKTLGEFSSEFWNELANGGHWQISYHDSRHLQKGVFVSLGEVSPEFDFQFYSKLTAITGTPIIPFVFSGRTIDDLEKDLTTGCTEKAKSKPDKGKTIAGQLWESFFRLGLKGFVFEPSDLKNLCDSEFAIFVLDTSALRLGIGSFLVDLFQQPPSSKSIWSIIPVQVILEIEDNSEYLKGNRSKDQIETLQKRPQATLVPLEINRLKRRCIPVEFLRVDPILLRKETLGDRVILESIKDLKRERGIDRNIFLITSDRYLAQIARLENIHAISVNIPHLDSDRYNASERTVYSVRYDAIRQDFVGCSLPRFVWDLAHAFGTIQMKNTVTGKVYCLNYYFTLSEKGVNDWEEDRLEVVVDGTDNAK